jgi:osmotically inducible protein OsmC
MKRGAIAEWSGVDTAASGRVTTDSGGMMNVPYTRASRFEQTATPRGANPEEMIAAALASCFTMTLAELLAEAGHPAHSIHVEVSTHLIKPGGRWTIPAMRLHCSVDVPGIDESELLAIAHEARLVSPVAATLRADITLTVSVASLEERQRTLGLARGPQA